MFKLKSGPDRVSKTILQYESAEAPRIKEFVDGERGGKNKIPGDVMQGFPQKRASASQGPNAPGPKRTRTITLDSGRTATNIFRISCAVTCISLTHVLTSPRLPCCSPPYPKMCSSIVPHPISDGTVYIRLCTKRYDNCIYTVCFKSLSKLYGI